MLDTDFYQPEQFPTDAILDRLAENPHYTFSDMADIYEADTDEFTAWAQDSGFFICPICDRMQNVDCERVLNENACAHCAG